MTTETSSEAHEHLRQQLYKEGASVGVFAPHEYRGPDKKISELRRMHVQAVQDPRVAFTLTETDGVLRWEEGYGFAAPSRRRAFRAGPLLTGRVIAPVNFERLGVSQVGAFLEHFDRQLTPSCDLRKPENGLRQFKNGSWSLEPAIPKPGGRILLFIHGTFSNCDAFISELNQLPEGAQLLADAQTTYDQVLGFDHATISVSPMLNATDLGRIFQNAGANVDVISHSRGGLVTRWWLEQFDTGGISSARAMLVGSPLDGTSLAAPDRLKAALDLLTNIGHALEVAGHLASGVFPFFTVVTGLLRVISSVTSIAAKTPVLDAALAMIPGLAAQSQIQNNNELGRLNRSSTRALTYFGVRSNFQTDDPGWKFWRYFVNIKERLEEAGATVVFDAENDLVVNTASMAVLARSPKEALISKESILDFTEKEKVYHTVYFRQKRTVDFIRQSFGIPTGGRAKAPQASRGGAKSS